MLVVVSLLLPFALVGNPAGADTVGNDKARVAALLAQLNAQTERESRLSEAFDQAQLHLQQVDATLAAAKVQIGQTAVQMSQDVSRVKSLAVESYMDGGAARELSLLIPGSADQIAVRGTYVAAATGSDNDAIDALRAAHIELGRKQTTLASAQAAATAAVTELASAQQAAAAAAAATSAAYTAAQAELGQAQLQAAEAAQAAANEARIEAASAAQSQAGSITAGSGSSGDAGSNEFGGGSPSVALPPPSSAAGLAIYWAKQELGKPYVYGGAGPDSFDCSGLTAWAWGHAGHPLVHSSEEQYYDTTHVSIAELEPGDLVFYGIPPHHVGIYVGGGEMIDALHTGTNVEYDSIYIESDLSGGGRVN